MRGIACLRGILSDGRLHVLGTRSGLPALRQDHGISLAVYRMQEVYEQGSGWRVPRWLSMGRDRDGVHGGFRGAYGSQAAELIPEPSGSLGYRQFVASNTTRSTWSFREFGSAI